MSELVVNVDALVAFVSIQLESSVHISLKPNGTQPLQPTKGM